MPKQRPSRISIPSFSFSAHERKSSRASIVPSRRSSIRTFPVSQEPLVAESVEAQSQPEVILDVEEPLFQDSFIEIEESTDRLPAPPSAALAAKWNEFLEGLSSSSPTDQPNEDAHCGSIVADEDLNVSEDELETFESEPIVYVELDVATPTVLRSPGKPKMIDVFPSISLRGGRARSSSYDSASSRYSDQSVDSESPPATPLSSTYGSDHMALSRAGSVSKDQEHSNLESDSGQDRSSKDHKRHARDLTGSFIPVMTDESESGDEGEIEAVRQTICRPASGEITRVWYKA